MTAALRRWHKPLSRSPGKRPQSLAAYALLYDLLAEMTGRSAEVFRLDHEASGRPVLRHDGADRPPAISLSHSADWIACAATETGEIGLDIEWAKPGRQFADLAQAAFGTAETAAVEAGGPAAFYRLWSMREAMAKAMGTGLAWVMDRRDRVPLQPGAGSCVLSSDGDLWSWHIDRPRPDLHFAIAHRRKEPDVNRSAMPLRKCRVSSELRFDSLPDLATAR